MSPPHEPHDPQDAAETDPRLVNYLLGLLPDEEAEPIEEASVADDQVAWQLRIQENDLVDAYVSGTLPTERRQQFERGYLISSRRREKVRIAQGLLAVTRRAAVAADIAGATPSRVTVARFGAGAALTRSRESETDGIGRRPRDGRERTGTIAAVAVATPVPPSDALGAATSRGVRAAVCWGCVAAAALLFIVAGVVLFHEMRMRDALALAQAERAAVDRRTQELERLLDDQRALQTDASRELVRVRAQLAEAEKQAAARPAVPAIATAARSASAIATAILLRPQTRAAGDVPTLSVRREAEAVPVTLLLEAQWFQQYRVIVKDPGTGATIWRSRAITPSTLAQSPVIPLVIPARLLQAQYYSLDLSGIGAQGAEVVGSYTLRIVHP